MLVKVLITLGFICFLALLDYPDGRWQARDVEWCKERNRIKKLKEEKKHVKHI